jgi:hypothetical protein
MMKVLTAATTIALAILGHSLPSYGQASTGEPFPSHERQSVTPFREYLAEDDGVVGRLICEGVPSWVISSGPEGVAYRPPVTFNGYLPYPNPYSSPMPFVVVNGKTDFCVLVAARGGKPTWRFSFSGVGLGIYRLRLETPDSTAKWYTMSVQQSDTTIGEVELLGRGLVREME